MIVSSKTMPSKTRSHCHRDAAGEEDDLALEGVLVAVQISRDSSLDTLVMGVELVVLCPLGIAEAFLGHGSGRFPFASAVIVDETFQGRGLGGTRVQFTDGEPDDLAHGKVEPLGEKVPLGPANMVQVAGLQQDCRAGGI